MYSIRGLNHWRKAIVNLSDQFLNALELTMTLGHSRQTRAQDIWHQATGLTVLVDKGLRISKGPLSCCDITTAKLQKTEQR
jgi:hypothetical protein